MLHSSTASIERWVTDKNHTQQEVSLANDSVSRGDDGGGSWCITRDCWHPSSSCTKQSFHKTNQRFALTFRHGHASMLFT